MAVGLPMKTTYANGDVYSASDVNDITGTINTYVPKSTYASKNRIINGDFCIDQRAAGTAKTILSSGSSYPAVDRWQMAVSTSVVATTQQITTDYPAGHRYSNKITFSTGQAIVAGSNSIMWQWIEGLNTYDLNWGTANAQSVTLSFWVKSSVTGNHAVQIYTGYSYVTTYNIAAANTWEKKSITIPGLTSGTASPADNTASISVGFVWGAGSSVQTTANTWTSGYYSTVSGAAAPQATTGATWLVTGVQLEAGSTATTFSRAGGTIQGELAACQRYYYRTTTGAGAFRASGMNITGAIADVCIPLQTTMRVAPQSIDVTGTAADYEIRHQNTFTTCSAVPTLLEGSWNSLTIRMTTAGGLTTGQACQGRTTTNGWIGWSAEL